MKATNDLEKYADYDSWTMSVVKTIIASAACLLIFSTYSADMVTGLGVTVFVMGGLLARYKVETTLTIRGICLALIGWLALLYGLSVASAEWALSAFLAQNVGVDSGKGLLLVADALLFIGMGGALGFALRFSALRHRFGSIAEVIFAVMSGALVLIQHRHNALDRPRFLADWALIQGIEPYNLILGIGVLAAVMTMMLTLKHRYMWSFVVGLLLLIMVGSTAYLLRDDVPLMDILDPQQQGQAQGAQDRLSDEQPPEPIAVALMHTDFTPPKPLLYFRQQVLSFYDGNRFSKELSPKYDLDVIQRFPSEVPSKVEVEEATGYRTNVDISMFLMANHPQPFALSNSVEVRTRPNPSPKRFVAAYDSVSQVLTVPEKRLFGRASIPDSWSPQKTAHYLARSSDPRYASLARELTEETDLRHHGDPLLKAFAVKHYLEKNGFYTLKEKHAGAKDPAASFLFGNFRGYCVHFAHSAVQLFRNLGIASRVALGYAVDLRTRGDGSALIIMANTAHAWPEIHVAGIGWIPFDIYPEQSDEPPPTLVQQSLESILGDLARDDKTKTAYQLAAKTKWKTLLSNLVNTAGWLVLISLLALYTIRYGRWLYLRRAAANTRQQYRLLLDQLSSLGLRRQSWETRTDFATRLTSVCPSLALLTHDYQASTFGRDNGRPSSGFLSGLSATRKELKFHIPLYRRLLGFLHPINWWSTR